LLWSVDELCARAKAAALEGFDVRLDAVNQPILSGSSKNAERPEDLETGDGQSGGLACAEEHNAVGTKSTSTSSTHAAPRTSAAPRASLPLPPTTSPKTARGTTTRPNSAGSSSSW
jgi:hypothetical protein